MEARRQLAGGSSLSVQELGAELDGDVEVGEVFSENSTADAVPSLEDDDRATRRGESGRAGEPGGARADDDDIYAS